MPPPCAHFAALASFVVEPRGHAAPNAGRHLLAAVAAAAPGAPTQPAPEVYVFELDHTAARADALHRLLAALPAAVPDDAGYGDDDDSEEEEGDDGYDGYGDEEGGLGGGGGGSGSEGSGAGGRGRRV